MNDQSIVSFLGNSDVDKYVIPKFQRPYSWNKDQIAQFLNDFDNVMESESPEHFFGLIVYVPNQNNERVRDIIDGQQRTTTITIVLSILRDWLRDIKVNTNIDEVTEEDVNAKISVINSCIKNDQRNPKLNTENENEYENEFLKCIISDITDCPKEKEPRKSYEEQDIKSRYEAKYNFMLDGAGGSRDKRKTKAKNALKNYSLIHNHIKLTMKDLKTDLEKVKYLMNVTDRVTKNFRVIEFKVASYDKAFEYFEVLNDRGLDVSALDLIKNNVLKRASSSEETTELFNSWKAVFSDTLNSNFNLIQFVRYSHMCEHGHITAKKIYPCYKEKILALDTASNVKAFIDDKLLTFAKIYKDCNLSNCETQHIGIHNSIQLVRSTKTTQWYSIAMAALYPFYSNKASSISVINKIVDLFEVIHEIMFSLNFVSYVANEIEKEFPKIAKEIKFGESETTFKKSLEKAIQNLAKFKVDQKLTFDILDFSDNEELVQSFYKNNDLGNMFIYFLKYNKNANNSDRICVTSLEHTYPQKPSKENWSNMANLNEDDKKEVTYSLGNFFNVPKPENTSYGNKSWSVKKKKYIEDKVFDVIDQNNDLHYSKVEEWNKDIIEKRTGEIRELWNESIK